MPAYHVPHMSASQASMPLQWIFIIIGDLFLWYISWVEFDDIIDTIYIHMVNTARSYLSLLKILMYRAAAPDIDASYFKLLLIDSRQK